MRSSLRHRLRTIIVNPSFASFPDPFHPLRADYYACGSFALYYWANTKPTKPVSLSVPVRRKNSSSWLGASFVHPTWQHVSNDSIGNWKPPRKIGGNMAATENLSNQTSNSNRRYHHFSILQAIGTSYHLQLLKYDSTPNQYFNRWLLDTHPPPINP